jgi:hypothetical protein
MSPSISRRTQESTGRPAEVILTVPLPCQPGNPVFSIYQSDIISYGPDLRRISCVNFARLLGIDEDSWEREANTQRAREGSLRSNPVLGEIYRDNPG